MYYSKLHNEIGIRVNKRLVSPGPGPEPEPEELA